VIQVHQPKVFEIGSRLIGTGQPAFVIAEISQNHCGELSKALELIEAAKEIGCDCAKFQTFTAEDMCADRSKMFTYLSQGKEVTESEFDLHKRYEFTPDQWAMIIAHCDKVGIPFMTTVQDPPNLELMLKLGINAIKVGSDDFDHLPNLALYASTGLPMILSKGMADLAEVDKVVRFMRARTDKLAIMHCVSIYPAEATVLNLRQIETLRALYPDIVWGFSDHSEGTLAASLAVSLGAKVIEKHFTLDHDLPGPDHWFSLDVTEMAQLVRDIRYTEQALGSGEVVPAPGEAAERQIRRRRLVAKTDLEPGAMLTEQTVAFKRADAGIFIADWDRVRGSRLKVRKSANQGVALGDIEFSN
jgi:N,N'-diacetyllegionaminate synthase